METESSETEPVRPEPVVKVKATAKVTDGMSLPKKKVNVTIKVKKTPTDFLLTRRVGRFLWRWSTSIREALFV
ncbi:MAG TPA: hypothetical protein DCX27_19685, partial [Balneola sp.]|nr:hypothetical protein [Balneola sp.]